VGRHSAELEFSTVVVGFMVQSQNLTLIPTRSNIMPIVYHIDPLHVCPHHGPHKTFHRRHASPTHQQDTCERLPHLHKHWDQSGRLHPCFLLLSIPVQANFVLLETSYSNRERHMHQPTHDCHPRLHPICCINCTRLFLRSTSWIHFLGFTNEKVGEGCAHDSHESRCLVNIAH
jgi:hypothetical protein